jgi:DNA-binding LacI/PurR family transcriptional regulator
MPASEAQILANRQNAAHSTGPKTEAGKERSRQNSLKHGMTGAGVVLAEADAAEVARRTVLFAEELIVIDEVGQALARRAALHSVRMERSADQQAAALSLRCRQVEAAFVPPEGVDAEEADRLRAEAVRIAMFDPSKEASLARQYETASERGFYRAVKELRQMDRQSDAVLKAEQTANVDAMMGSIFAAQKADQEMDDEMDALYPELKVEMPLRPANSSYLPPTDREVDVPMTIGRSR